MFSTKSAAFAAMVACVAATASPVAAEVPLERLVTTASTSESGPMDREKSCLAEAVFHEAGSEPMAGRIAVAHVILNRTRSGVFPRTVCGVVNQKGQFTYPRGRGIRRGAERQWIEARAVAALALAGVWSDVVRSALYFRVARLSVPVGGRPVARIGGHVFFAGR